MAADPTNSALATAIIGLDTLWGGDVLSPSGTGRAIADCWFSDDPLPGAYTHPAAAALRRSGGVTAKTVDVAAIAEYLDGVDIRGAIAEVAACASNTAGLRGGYFAGLSECFGVMWDLAMEVLGRGAPVPYERCVLASTGRLPDTSQPDAKRTRVAALLAERGYPSTGTDGVLGAVEAWRHGRLVAGREVPALSGALIAQLSGLCARHLLPYLPGLLHGVPLANIRFLPIENAWFSGSMNYLGRARRADGTPEFEATYEINAALQISVPEFAQLVSHEVVPGHVTTFAFLQRLFVGGDVGFEASVLTMNTRAATLFEGIANNAILMAYGVTEVEDLPDPDLQIGVLLALLQDDAKNQASVLTWRDGWSRDDVARALRRDYLVSAERADKLSGAWGRHPLMGRMYLPAYRAGTDVVAGLRRHHPPGRLLPVLYGCRGLVDVVTLPLACEEA